MGYLLVLTYALAIGLRAVNSQDAKLVPAVITFGDSAVDVGNNDYIHTLFKAISRIRNLQEGSAMGN